MYSARRWSSIQLQLQTILLPLIRSYMAHLSHSLHRVSQEHTLNRLREVNSPPPAHCTRSKSDSHDSHRGQDSGASAATANGQLQHSPAVPNTEHSDEGHYLIILSNEDSVASPPPLISNDDLVKINPMYQHLIDNDPDAYYPWISNLEEIGLEEEDVIIPCGFTNALYAMTATTEEQITDYHALLDTHITAEFAAAVPIRPFMLDEGIKVFTNMT